MNRALIDEYARGGAVLTQAIEGLEPAQFRATPVPGTWSIGQIVLHLMDSDLIASERMKRIIAEDNPMLIGYDESSFAQRLFYADLDPHAAAEIFVLNRRLTADILRRLPDPAFARFGTHNERGKMQLGEIVGLYVNHLDHHLKFLKHKKQLLGRGG
jgi:uncharacterized damage-inducible protein DinB